MRSSIRAVYEAVVSLPSTHLDALEHHLGQSAQDIEAALLELRGLGLIEASQMTDGQWRAVAPTLAIGRRIAEAEQVISSRLAGLSADRALMTSLDDVYRQGKADPHSVLRLADRDEVLAHLGELVETVSFEVAAFVTNFPSPEAVTEAKNLDALMIERGVQLRTLCLDGFRRDRRVRKALLDSAALGVDVRTLAALPTRMIIFDRTHAVIAVDPDDPARGALVMSHRAVVNLLVDLFERHWLEATPFIDEPALEPSAEPRLSPMEHHVLRMLAKGIKDESIARTTGQSVRTVRRIISTLSEKVGARSRFDLALRAAGNGWVSVPHGRAGRDDHG